MSDLDKALFNDFHYTSLPKILLKFDKISMAHSVESREPFLDYRLVSYIFSLPGEAKMNSKFSKLILRDSMKEHLPKSILKRRGKRGFDVSLNWFNQYYKDIITEVIMDDKFKSISFIDHKKIRNFITQKNNNINYKKIFRYLQIFFLQDSFNSIKNKNV